MEVYIHHRITSTFELGKEKTFEQNNSPKGNREYYFY